MDAMSIFGNYNLRETLFYKVHQSRCT